MDELSKVSSLQLYTFWKNLSIGLLIIVAVLSLSVILPYYCSPIVALIAAAVLYTMLYNNRINDSGSCMVVIYAMFFCMISYSFITIIVNILYVWGLIWLPREFTFFSKPYIPSLSLMPICLLTMIVIHIRRHKLTICVDCRLAKGDPNERGKIGNIYSYESEFQLRNLIILFGLMSVLVWAYYLLYYIDTDVNGRDWYVFFGIVITGFVLDEIYFIFRYYNLYLDLKENDEIISEDELREMTSKTYLRFYVICGDDIYLDPNVMSDDGTDTICVIDTPFVTKRNVNGITIPEVNNIIRKLTGVRDGELRFFFGRRNPDMMNYTILRYFYFIDGKKEDYEELNVSGRWMSFDKVKHIYSYKPVELAPVLVSDITRLATIVLTQKIFDESGFRKNKIKAYQPSFNLIEVRKGNFELQNDKWLRISMFNSDTRFYRLKRWWKNMSGGGDKRYL